MDLKSQESQSPYFKLNGCIDFQVQNLGLVRERNKATTAGKDSLGKNIYTRRAWNQADQSQEMKTWDNIQGALGLCK